MFEDDPLFEVTQRFAARIEDIAERVRLVRVVSGQIKYAARELKKKYQRGEAMPITDAVKLLEHIAAQLDEITD